jgi:hypothetical protein
VSTLVRRAYRGSGTDSDVQGLLRFYTAERTRGGTFEAGIHMALRALLVQPAFLFRIEHNPPNVAAGSTYRINDVELASRLSFFLWSSIPDDELLNAATHGTLSDHSVLERQVRRMIADERSQALVKNFAAQWLYLRNMQAVFPNSALYPDFDDNLRQSLRRETELFFDSIIREDHSILELLTANYTFVDERLARHYGIPGVYGSNFRRVVLDDDRRHGLLGQGSILTVTSNATRTSPVLRGKWILENILGAPPPPPPSDVPPLNEEAADIGSMTMRQRMEQHRANPACAACHAQMDPLGLSLEAFDAVGQRGRVRGAENAVDLSGTMPDGTKFEGPNGLRDVLLSHSQQFVQTTTERLLTYALGRGVEYYDAPAVRKVVRDAAKQNYAVSALILGLVESTPFQMRIADEPTPRASTPADAARR